jgi:uncharacterized SAM-binding protein YcdF (DUF218 family)
MHTIHKKHQCIHQRVYYFYQNCSFLFMFFILSKLFTFLLLPFTWVTILIVWHFFTKSEQKKKILLIVSGVIYLIFTSTILLNTFAKVWDVAPAQIPPEKEYSCAILLGGYTSTDDSGSGYFNISADRFFQTLQLYRQGKVEHILLTGGNGSLLNNNFNEANWAKKQLLKSGIPASAILIDSNSRNTFENAEFSKKILDSAKLIPPYVLVTSAFHMRRASWIFKKLGMDIIPFTSTDIVEKRENNIFADFIPNIHTMDIWPFYIKEIIGLYVYKLEARRILSK